MPGTRKRYLNEDTTYITEGAYLNYEYEATRGQAFSVLLMGYALSLESMAGVEIDPHRHLGTQYRNTISSLGSAFQEQIIDRDSRILLWPADDFDLLLLSAAYQSGLSPVWLSRLDVEGVLQAAGDATSVFLEQISSKLAYSISNHDECIVVPWSPVVSVIR